MTTPLQNVFASIISLWESAQPPDHTERPYRYARREFLDPRAETAHRRFTIDLPTARSVVSQNDEGFVCEYQFNARLYFDRDGLVDFSNEVGLWAEAQQLADLVDQAVSWPAGTWAVITGPISYEYVGEDGEDHGRILVNIPLQITVAETA